VAYSDTTVAPHEYFDQTGSKEKSQFIIQIGVCENHSWTDCSAPFSRLSSLEAQPETKLHGAVLGTVRGSVLIVHNTPRGRGIDIDRPISSSRARIQRHEVIEDVDELE